MSRSASRYRLPDRMTAELLITRGREVHQLRADVEALQRELEAAHAEIARLKGLAAPVDDPLTPDLFEHKG
jgi:outer membrane protein TolC